MINILKTMKRSNMTQSFKRTLVIFIWLMAVYALFAVLSPNTIVAEAKQPTKVSICHKTNSETNPYIFMTVSLKGKTNGHEGHSGDIFNVSSPDDCVTNQDPPGSSETEPNDPPVIQEPSVTPEPSHTPEPSPTSEPSPTPTPTPQYGTTNICHYTGDSTTPYEFIQITDDTTYELHANHTWDIFDVETPEDCPTSLRKFMLDYATKFPPLFKK